MRRVGRRQIARSDYRHSGSRDTPSCVEKRAEGGELIQVPAAFLVTEQLENECPHQIVSTITTTER